MGSLRKFVYQHQNFIYCACTVRRCLQEPCGKCGGRRLAEAATGEESVMTVNASVRVQGKETAPTEAPTNNPAVLPTQAIGSRLRGPRDSQAGSRLGDDE